MATIKSFEDIVAWQKARSLNKELYELTNLNAFARDFSLKDQIRRASVSIMANIAEGFERSGNKEFRQFLAIAKASAGEVRCLLHVASDVGYINEDVANSTINKITEISKMISGLMLHIKESDYKGSKY